MELHLDENVEVLLLPSNRITNNLLVVETSPKRTETTHVASGDDLDDSPCLPSKRSMYAGWLDLGSHDRP